MGRGPVPQGTGGPPPRRSLDLRGKEMSVCGLYKPLVVPSDVYILYFHCVSPSLGDRCHSASTLPVFW